MRYFAIVFRRKDLFSFCCESDQGATPETTPETTPPPKTPGIFSETTDLHTKNIILSYTYNPPPNTPTGLPLPSFRFPFSIYTSFNLAINNNTIIQIYRSLNYHIQSNHCLDIFIFFIYHTKMSNQYMYIQGNTIMDLLV